jgi:O-antigen ligase
VDPTDRPQQLSFAAGLLMLVVLLMPFPVVLVKFTHGNAPYDYQAILFPSDLPLMALILVMAPRAVARVRRLGPVTACWALLLAWMVVAFAFHPSARGVADLVRLAGVLAMVVAALELATFAERGAVLVTVAAVAVFEAVIAVAQIARHAPVGLSTLGEFHDPFNRFGSALAPQGTMIHPYLLAGLAALVAMLLLAPALHRRQPAAWLALLAAAVVPVGITYSRAAVLGLALAGLCVLSGLRVWRGRGLAVLATLCLGVGVPALIWSSGWLNRANQSVRARSGAQLATDRGWLIHEADTLIVDHPVVGVGPGRYVIALKDKFHVERNRSVGVFKPVHNLPMLLTAEGGIPAGIAMTLVLVVAGWRGLRGGRLGSALFLVYLPFTLLDHFPYTFPQGLVMTGLWLGAIEVLARDRGQVETGDR